MNALDIVTQQVAESVRVKQAILDDHALLSHIAEVADLCAAAYLKGGKVIFAGNGGSAADAQHLAGELVSKFYFDRPALPAIALTTDTSVMTAIGNDYGFERLFARQVEAHGNRGDVFVGISTSGNSRNVVEAVRTCREMGITTIGLTGAKPCQMDTLCDFVLKVPSTETPRIQECQTLIGHILCCIVEARLFTPQHQ
jgi:D-sedoheptulose 7-phosphate isomerase